MFNLFKKLCHFTMWICMLVAGFILSPKPGWSFWINKFGLPISQHRQITKEALEPFDTLLSFGKQVSFNKSKSILDFIIVQNELTDLDQDPPRHCDNEAIPRCTARLGNLKVTIIKDSFTDPHSAWTRLGTALHTVQDFYSHTTQVEQGGELETRLGESTFGLSPSAIGDACILGTFFLEAPLTSGYWWEPWDNVNNTLPYYEKDGFDKCVHGGPQNFTIGINKDGPTRGPLFFDAKELAKNATIEYVNKVIAGIKATPGTDEQHDLAICALFGFVTPVEVETCLGSLVANAGPDQNVTVGDAVQLDGSQSEPNPTLLTFSWEILSKPNGSTAILSNSTSVKPTFTADKEGQFLIRLTVSGGGHSSFDLVLITATASTDTISVTSSVTYKNGIESFFHIRPERLEIPKFDPSLGTLTGITCLMTISASADLFISAGAHNPPTLVEASLFGQASLFVSSICSVELLAAAATTRVVVPAGEGAAGGSVTLNVPGSASNTTVAEPLPPALSSLFTASTPNETLSATVSGIIHRSVIPIDPAPGVLIGAGVLPSSEVSISVNITYKYQAIKDTVTISGF